MRFNPYAAMAAKVKTVDKRTGDEFNPHAFSAKDPVTGTRKVSSKERVFDNRGNINASSTKEALAISAELLKAASEGEFDVEHRPVTGSMDIDASEGDYLLRQAFSDPTSEGFKQVGQALLNPIKEIIDYESVMRKVWAPRTVKTGEVIRYDKDAFVVGHVIAEDGQTPQSVVEGKYIYPPECMVTAYPSIELMDQARAQYDILARTQDRSRQAIEYQEDLAGANLLLAGGNVVNSTTFYASMNLATIEGMRYQVERHRLVANMLIINRQEVSDFINTLSTQVDPVTLRELVMAGFIGQIMGMGIVTTAGTNTYEILQPGQSLVVTDPEHLGGMAIRQELQSEPVTEFHEGRPRRGWFWYEMMALALVNPKGVAIGQKT